MKVFNPRHLLRHVGAPVLREFMSARPIAARLSVDWTAPEQQVPDLVCNAVQALEDSPVAAALDAGQRDAVQRDLFDWHEDLRRVHLMSNDLAIAEFLIACGNDQVVIDAFADREVHEKAMWMLANREQAFRDAELHLAFIAKTNGRYWKKHRIDPGLEVLRDCERLEVFGNEVAKLYIKDGGGRFGHVEYSRHASDGRIQLTIYVQGPVTALPLFTNSGFQRLTTRLASEAALAYNPATGHIETVVQGGSGNHAAVLELFGRHVLSRPLRPEAVEKARYRLNALRDGVLEPAEDLSRIGVDKIRIRRAHLTQRQTPDMTIRIEASPIRAQPDAIQVARDTLKVQHQFETEYDLDGATMIVYPFAAPGRKGRHFSFEVYASGSSTITNLPQRHQPVAWAVLRALGVTQDDGAA